MTNIPENATIVYVEDLDKYYIRVDKGAVSYVWETALNLEQIIESFQLEGKDTVTLSSEVVNQTSLDFDKQWEDPETGDYFIFLGDIKELQEEGGAALIKGLNELEQIGKDQPWWRSAAFVDEWFKLRDLATTDGTLDASTFNALLKSSQAIGKSLSDIGYKRANYDRWLDLQLDPDQYEIDADILIESYKYSAGQSLSDKDVEAIMPGIKAIVDLLNDGSFGDGEEASNYASLLVQSLIDPNLKVDKPQEVIDAMEGISYQGTTKGRGKVEELMAKWLPRSLWGDVKIAEHAAKLRRNADYEYELIDIFQEKRYANYSMYDKEIPWENIVSNKLQAVKNVWGIDVEWDNPILDELIRMNDTTKENQYLREEGLKNGVSKVVDDLALSEVGAYGEGIVQGQAFTEGGP